MTAARRILLVEDNDLIARQWERAILARDMDCLRACTLQEASEHVARWDEVPCADVLLDLKLPDGDGAALLPMLKALDPRPGVAVVTGYLDSERSIDLHGMCTIMVPKPAGARTLIAVLDILEGSRQSRPLVESFADRYRLSERERAVLFAALRGMNNQEMADFLACDRGTIATYWSRIFKKTGWRSQRDVIANLFRYGFGEAEPPPSSRPSDK